jgi:hypothetical protein
VNPPALLATTQLEFLESLLPRDKGTYIFVAVCFMLVAAAFVWAAFLRRRGTGRRSRVHHHSHQVHSHTQSAASRPWSVKTLFTPRRHRRHHTERPRNPTLAEAGGLPPVRGDQRPPP